MFEALCGNDDNPSGIIVSGADLALKIKICVTYLQWLHIYIYIILLKNNNNEGGNSYRSIKIT